jgi:hypothetical protein
MGATDRPQRRRDTALAGRPSWRRGDKRLREPFGNGGPARATRPRSQLWSCAHADIDARPFRSAPGVPLDALLGGAQGLDAINVGPDRLGCVPQVDGPLSVEPEFRCVPKQARKPQRHLGA